MDPRKADDPNFDAGGQQRSASQLGGDTGIGMVLVEHIFRRGLARSGIPHSDARGKEEWARGPPERATRRFDRARASFSRFAPKLAKPWSKAV